MSIQTKGMVRSRIFRIGTLADEVVFSVAEYKKGIVSEKDQISLLAAKEFLENILHFDRGERGQEEKVKGALLGLERAEELNWINSAWIKSKIPFPTNDEEFEKELLVFICTLESMAEKEAIDTVGEAKVNNVERLFSALGKMTLIKVHKSPLHG